MRKETIIPKKSSSSLPMWLTILKTIKIELIIFLLFTLAFILYDIYLFQEKLILLIGIPFATSITIRMEQISLKKIGLTNLLFGYIVGVIDGFLFWFAHWFPARYEDDGFAVLAAPIIVLVYACIVGSIALLWGWIVHLLLKTLNYK